MNNSLNIQTSAFAWGAAALFAEILFSRALSTHLGDALSVQVAVMASFLVGLAAGARLAHRAGGRLWLAAGLLTITLPGFLPGLKKAVTLVSFTAKAQQIFVCVGLILPLSVLFGVGLPLLSKFLKSVDGECLAFKQVYLWSNIGALLGIVGAEFWAVRHLGLQNSFWLLSFWCLLLTGLTRAVSQESDEGTKPIEQEKRTQLALLLLSVSSAAFQVFLLRSCFYLFYPHRENLAVGLLVVLSGLTIGSEAARRWRWSLSQCCYGAALSVALAMLTYQPLSHLFFEFGNSLRGQVMTLPALKLLVALLLGLPACIFFGASIPSLAHEERNVDVESGRLLWISGLGNVLGYLSYLLILHPYLSQGIALTFIGGLTIVAVSLLNQARVKVTIPLCAALLIGGFLWSDSTYYVPRLKAENASVKVFKSGGDSASLITTPSKSVLTYNGHRSIVVQKNGRINGAELLVGTAPALYVKNRGQALVIGLGTGLTAWAASECFNQTDVVELTNAMGQLSHHLGDLNHDVLRRDNVRLQWGDARLFLPKATYYDAIICTTGDATYFSTSKLHTVEFYERVKASLKPGGAFCLWISREYSGEGMEIVLTTLHHVFPHCRLRMVGKGYYLLVASEETRTPPAFEDFELPEPLRREFQNSYPDLPLPILFDESELSAELFGGKLPFEAPSNTDDLAALEFAAVSHHRAGTYGWNPLVEYQAGLNIDAVGKSLPESRQQARLILHQYFDSRFLTNFSP